jgi:hypothetical protein
MGNIFRKEKKSSLKKLKLEKDAISSEQIEKFVNEILNNKDVNISYLPDGAEKEIYKNLLVYILNITKELIKTTKVEVVGHEITFTIKPKV